MKYFWILNLIAGLFCILLGIFFIYKNWHYMAIFEIIIGIWNLYYVYRLWKK